MSVTDALGHTTSYAYDALNRQIGRTDALGNTATSAYDPEGNRLASTDAAGKTTASATTPWIGSPRSPMPPAAPSSTPTTRPATARP